MTNAYVSGMKEDLGFEGNQLNLINTIFTVGYELIFLLLCFGEIGRLFGACREGAADCGGQMLQLWDDAHQLVSCRKGEDLAKLEDRKGHIKPLFPNRCLGT